ncbi:hypothetical protein BKP45_05070 [Anaerobacillus alkalidiazotrophicus]|uniref:Uncharacterized protein n=1 Tax=Anaerobacillus alkalidiazotrophicus TaxID=472963 RepID=A0A1S2MBU0_9BACI|nr:hypothetical protein [Anaerobacillus alkalidiazotrophicus]OIJ22050.1 hypothetical protein BKP45_05070 [Anaerobacillus alkalidiazotrophicus]
MAIDFSGISLPFNAGDLLTSAVELLGVVGPFVLLGLAVMFAPKIIGLIRNAAGSRGRTH